ncbi:MAG: NAD(P)/FAD-dependent oxidoreductase [Clostridia bacterium]|nr:NAD(P)/FAD-dependent oxidoreductase [Clostridia bacterium]
MNKKYDVAIIGAGISGICTAYELVEKRPDLKIVMLEQGNDINERICPIIANKTEKCIKCKKCSIMKGFGGAGSFSDGKYNLTTEFGGWLNRYISDEKVMELIEYVDRINVKFGACEEMYSTDTPVARSIEKKAIENDLHLLHARVKHLGTENNFNILKAMNQYLKGKIELRCGVKALDIVSKEDGYSIILDDSTMVDTKFLVAAPGRAGAEWFSDTCKKMNISLINNQVDIGVRVEVPAIILEDITSNIYEAKIKYRTKCYGNIVRTFCMNPYGHVVTENVDGVITVNGHSYSDKALGSSNTNFALLVSAEFTEPFNDPYQYGKRVASFSNLLGNGIIVQRFGDLINGRRTNKKRLEKSFVRPTLTSAEPGDLSYVLPKRPLDSIIEMIYALDKLFPGIANEDTLLYGVEVKFYSARPELSNCLETKYQNFFAIGDGAGVTRGLAQAGASGILVAREILRRI